MKKLRSKRHVVEQTHFARLSAEEKARVNKIVALGIPATIIFWMVCFNFITTRVWRWPFFLAFYVGPVFGAALGLAAIIAPIWALLSWASAARKAECKRAQTNLAGEDARIREIEYFEEAAGSTDL